MTLRAALTDPIAPLWAALGEVMDPEIPVSLVDLGLVYGIRLREGHAEVDLTFTATGCPCIDFIRDDVRERLLREPGVDRVSVRDVWDPPWTKDRVSERGRARMREMGVSL